MQVPFLDPLSEISFRFTPHPLFGRESEMHVLRTLLESVAQNQPQSPHALIVSGDIGVGKSRLLAELCSAARQQGFLLLESRASDIGKSIPFLPIIEAIRPVLRSMPVDRLRACIGLETSYLRQQVVANENEFLLKAAFSRVGNPLVTALSRLFPELPQYVGVTPIQEILSPAQEKFRLFDAIATLLEGFSAEQPVLLCIDNLQWADSATLELTLYLTVRLHSSRVALASGTRPPGTGIISPITGFDSEQESPANADSRQEQAWAIMRTLSDLVRHAMLILLPLQPLDAQAAQRYTHKLLPENIAETTRQSLLARAEGNPFFLEELARTLPRNKFSAYQTNELHLLQAPDTMLPQSIILAVEQRLHTLPPLCLQALRVAALFGRTFSAPILATVMHLVESQLQPILDEAEQATLITQLPITDTTLWDDMASDSSITQHMPPPVYMFCQGIVQEVLHNLLPAYEAHVLHNKIGNALEHHYRMIDPHETDPFHAAELARHYVLGGKQQEAFHWSLIAGEYATRQQGHREAIEHFRTALKLWDAHTDDVAQRNEQPLRSRAQLHLLIGQSWFQLGELTLASKAFQQALAARSSAISDQAHTPERIPEPALFSAHANRLLADVYRMQGHYEQALAHLTAAKNALQTAEQQTAPSTNTHSISERILLLQAQATLDLLQYRSTEAESALWQSHQLAAESGDRDSQAFALHLIGWIKGWGERINETIRLQEQAHELYVAIGDPFRATLGDQGLGIIYQTLGMMEKARLHTLRGIEQARHYGVRPVLGWLYWNMAMLALFEGDWNACNAHLQQAMQEVETTNNIRLRPVVLQAQAELAFRQGQWQEAEQYFQSLLQAAMNTEWYASAMALYGHFLAVTGRKAAAKRQLEQAIHIPEPPGYSGHFYIPFLAEGFLHLQDDSHNAVSYIERIQKLHGFLYYGVAVDRILGEVAASNGDWERAERAFEDGLALCRRVHNEPEEAFILYEQARSTLMRSRAQDHYQPHVIQQISHQCEQARSIFLRYNMHRATLQVDTLLEGIQQLEGRERLHIVVDSEPTQSEQKTRAIPGDYVLDLHLTRRELEVLRLVAEGYTDREVADVLVISHRTVNRHLGNIFVKLDVPGRSAAVAYAIRRGLVG